MTNNHFVPHSDQIWKKIFIALAALCILFMPLCSTYHGMSDGEWLSIIYGHDIYNYFFNGSKAALDYDVQNWTQIAGLHYRGGLYDFALTFLHKHIFTSTDELTVRHGVNALFGAMLFIYTGLLAKHFGGWRTGVLAFIFIALSPRILGESMNNAHDIPFAASSLFFIYHLVCYLSSFGIAKARWKYTILMGLGLGLSINFRINGLLLIPFSLLFIAAFYLCNCDFKKQLYTEVSKSLQMLFANLIITFIIGYLIAVVFWPWAMQDPLSNPLKAFLLLNENPVQQRMQFEGSYILNTDLHRTYTLKWMIISIPIFILTALTTSILFIKPLLKRYGRESIFLCLFTPFVTLAYHSYSHSVLHDSWSYFFYIYPGIIILAAFASNHFLEKFEHKKNHQILIISFIVIGMSFPFAWIVKSFPNEYVYFNELEGGIKKAFGVYELDYHQNSAKQATDWIKQNTKVKSGKTIVASNSLQVHQYFEQDTANFTGIYVRYNDRDTKDWDYFLTYTRGIPLLQLATGRWPPANAVYTVFADKVALSAVLERKTKLDMIANAEMDKQHLDTAFVLYQKAISIDATNEIVLVRYATLMAQRGLLNDALNVLEQALLIDPASIAVHNLQLQIYRAKGDVTKAEQAESTLRSLMEK